MTCRGRSLDELAGRRGINAAALRDSVEQYNRFAAGSAEDEFGRTGRSEPLSRPPWVLLGPAKAYFTTTEGGAAVNHQFQVLDAAGDVIPGLYAVGQNGLGGAILWGHGLHIAWAMTSGRLAGRHAMRSG